MNMEFDVPEGTQAMTTRGYFEAPRSAVWAVLVDPALIPQWWGPEVLATTVEEMHVTPGGLWRFTQRDPEGKEYRFHGYYHDVTAPERLVYTFEFEGQPGQVMLEVVRLEELSEHRTGLVIVDLFESVRERDAALATGMEQGAAESMQRFARLVEG